MLGVCYRGDLDISGEMVRGGNAVAYTRYAWRYIPHELLARSKGRGIWATEFAAERVTGITADESPMKWTLRVIASNSLKVIKLSSTEK